MAANEATRWSRPACLEILKSSFARRAALAKEDDCMVLSSHVNGIPPADPISADPMLLTITALSGASGVDESPSKSLG